MRTLLSRPFVSPTALQLLGCVALVWLGGCAARPVSGAYWGEVGELERDTCQRQTHARSATQWGNGLWTLASAGELVELSPPVGPSMTCLVWGRDLRCSTHLEEAVKTTHRAIITTDITLVARTVDNGNLTGNLTLDVGCLGQDCWPLGLQSCSVERPFRANLERSSR